MKFVFAVALALLLQCPAPAQASSGQACEPGLEGSYVGQLGASGKARLNLICLDDKRMVASFADLAPTTFLANLPFVEADGDQLILAAASLRPEDREDLSSKSLYTYLKLDSASLRSGKAKGIYFSGNVRAFLPVALHKEQAFPEFKPARRSFAKNLFPAAFRIGNSAFGPGLLLADLVFDTPMISLIFGDSPAIHLVDGPQWDGSGLISSTAPSGDGEADGRKLFYFRGLVNDENSLDFYLVTPNEGLKGPFHATRE